MSGALRVRQTRSFAIVAALLATPCLAQGLDSDLRFIYLQPEGNTELSSSGDSTNWTWDTASRWGVQYLLVVDLPIIAIHAGVEASREERSDPGIDYEVFAGHGVVGGRLTLIPVFLHLEANAEVGYGVATLEVDSDSDDGDWLGYTAGLDVVGGVPVPGLFRVELGLGGGWLHSESSHEIAGSTVDVTADNNLYGRVFVGLYF